VSLPRFFWGDYDVKKRLIVAAAIAVLPFAAQAQEIDSQPGFYIQAGGGAQWTLGSQNNTTTYTGWAVGGGVGYDFVGPRAEIEVGYGQVPNNVNIPGTAINNKTGALTAMANVLYDFFPRSVITPFVGGGIGVAFVDSNTSLGSTAFAFQGIVGIGYQVNEQLRFGIEGRYLGSTNVTLNYPILGNPTYNISNLMALAGVQYKFAAAPPPPPPQPPVVAPPSFMVFFDWDRSNLSQQALATIQQAANVFKQKGNARITATGHTDTSGPESYNMALSLRRANAVKDALVRDGVPPQAITVIGMGEKGLLVPTGDGVREPQNRRVEIVIQ
jgi:opacity protein-like surface antigen